MRCECWRYLSPLLNVQPQKSLSTLNYSFDPHIPYLPAHQISLGFYFDTYPIQCQLNPTKRKIKPTVVEIKYIEENIFEGISNMQNLRKRCKRLPSRRSSNPPPLWSIGFTTFSPWLVLGPEKTIAVELNIFIPLIHRVANNWGGVSVIWPFAME